MCGANIRIGKVQEGGLDEKTTCVADTVDLIRDRHGGRRRRSQIRTPGEIFGETLNLNGYGIRKKFFFKIYLGSLYTAHTTNSVEQVLADPGGKLIRLDFLYDKAEKEKIVGAFAEGFEKNSPGLGGDGNVKTFLGWFDADFVRGDQVDLLL